MGRIREVDGLRGIAILLVISFHFINNQLSHRSDTLSVALTQLTGFGWVGVDLFFVLSGFLIGTVLLRAKEKPGYFVNFYKRRFFRILPLYFLLLLVVFGLNLIPAIQQQHFLGGEMEIIPKWSYFLFVQNFFMAAAGNMGNDTTGITWSIAIEEQFYLIIPAFLFYVAQKRQPYWLGLTILLSIACRAWFDHWIADYVLLICRMDGLSIGLLIAYGYFYYPERVSQWFTARRLMLAGFFMLLILGVIFYLYRDFGPFKHTLFSLIFGMMLWMGLLHQRHIFAAFLRNPLLVFVGQISYSLYLYHYLILGLMLFLINGSATIGINSLADAWVSVLAFFTAIGAAYASWRWIETPLARLARN